MSGELIAKAQPCDGTDVFALPPAALSPNKAESASRRSSRSDPTFVPASPASPDLAGRGRSNQSSRSGTATKRPLEDFDLPPPPTRTRKIIQMKPKAPAASKSPAVKSAKDDNKDNGKAASQTSSEPAANATTPKKKQPSSTSAAGRKIARKTAHSLIERRRRSKMNEEFSTLKDMIPACRGQEMHKLAILQVVSLWLLIISLPRRSRFAQASIDYVNYLEQCIQDLKTAGTNTAAPPSPTSPEFLGEAEAMQPSHRTSSANSYSTSASPELLPPTAQHADTFPSFSPRTCMPSAPALPEAPSVLPSPALGPSYRSNADIDIDHEASAALLMLTRDRRGTADSINEQFSVGPALAPGEEARATDAQRRKGMSVHDLLIS